MTAPTMLTLLGIGDTVAYDINVLGCRGRRPLQIHKIFLFKLQPLQLSSRLLRDSGNSCIHVRTKLVAKIG